MLPPWTLHTHRMRPVLELFRVVKADANERAEQAEGVTDGCLVYPGDGALDLGTKLGALGSEVCCRGLFQSFSERTYLYQVGMVFVLLAAGCWACLQPSDAAAKAAVHRRRCCWQYLVKHRRRRTLLCVFGHIGFAGQREAQQSMERIVSDATEARSARVCPVELASHRVGGRGRRVSTSAKSGECRWCQKRQCIVKSLRRVQGRRTLACNGELVVCAAGRKFVEANSGVGCRPQDNNVSRLS